MATTVVRRQPHTSRFVVEVLFHEALSARQGGSNVRLRPSPGATRQKHQQRELYVGASSLTPYTYRIRIVGTHGAGLIHSLPMWESHREGSDVEYARQYASADEALEAAVRYLEALTCAG